LVVRSTADPRDVIAPVRDALRGIDSEQRPGFSLLRDRFHRQLEPATRVATLSAIIGGIALALAMTGLFGVTAFVAGQRRREIGVRLTLGAERRDVVRLLVKDSLRPVAIGVSCGLVLAFWAGRILQDSLYGLSGHDPLAMVLSATTLLASAVVAAYLPARRAAAVDPAITLRAQ
jgi:putative ABC transport system permease protein